MAEPAPPPASSPTKVADPLGVPGGLYLDPSTNQPYYSGYTAQQPYQATFGYADPINATAGSFDYTAYRSIQPRYFDGDQYRPATLGIDDMIALQNGLDAAGLYSGDYTKGAWGPSDWAAYERLLAMANAAGLDEKTALDRAINGAKSKDAKGTKRQPLVVTLSNPAELKKTLRNVSRDLYGGDLPDEDVQRFVSAYQALEANATTQAYAMGNESGGTVVAPPDPSTVAEEQIRVDHPLEVRNQGFVNSMDAVLQTFTQRRPGGGT